MRADEVNPNFPSVVARRKLRKGKLSVDSILTLADLAIDDIFREEGIALGMQMDEETRPMMQRAFIAGGKMANTFLAERIARRARKVRVK